MKLILIFAISLAVGELFGMNDKLDDLSQDIDYIAQHMIQR